MTSKLILTSRVTLRPIRHGRGGADPGDPAPARGGERGARTGHPLHESRPPPGNPHPSRTHPGRPDHSVLRKFFLKNHKNKRKREAFSFIFRVFRVFFKRNFLNFRNSYKITRILKKICFLRNFGCSFLGILSPRCGAIFFKGILGIL